MSKTLPEGNYTFQVVDCSIKTGLTGESIWVTSRVVDDGQYKRTRVQHGYRMEGKGPELIKKLIIACGVFFPENGQVDPAELIGKEYRGRFHHRNGGWGYTWIDPLPDSVPDTGTRGDRCNCPNPDFRNVTIMYKDVTVCHVCKKEKA
jgi:hypothetical protein